MSLYTKLCLVLAGQGQGRMKSGFHLNPLPSYRWRGLILEIQMNIQGSRDSISKRLNRSCDIFWMSQDCVPEMQKHFTGLTQAQGPGRILYNKIRVKDQ